MTEPDKPLEQMTAIERLDLGMSYYKEGEFDEAIAVLKTISTSEEPAIYALSQNLLGSIYMVSLGRLDEAITAWSKIRRGDNPKTYAEAQFRLGFAYQAQDRLGDAITAWSKIRRGDDPETYAQAQLVLGIVYKDQDELDQAIEAWSNIHREDNPETYAWAQLNLGKIYAKSKKVKEAKEAYRNAREFFYYEGERGYRIHRCPPEVIKKLRDIAKNTDEVLKSLQIIPDFESQVAHYSRASTAFTLLEKREKIRSRHISGSVLFVVLMTRRKGWF